MAEFNAGRVLAEAYTLYKKHHDGMGLDFKIAIAQVRKEAKAEALRDAAERLRAGNLMIGPNYIDPCDAADWLEHRADVRATSNYLNDRADRIANKGGDIA